MINVHAMWYRNESGQQLNEAGVVDIDCNVILDDLTLEDFNELKRNGKLVIGGRTLVSHEYSEKDGYRPTRGQR